MISKVQGKTISGELSVKAGPHLSALEKAMLRWVVVDPEDRVLDATVGKGLMAEYLRRNMQCEVCGVSADMEDVRAARARLQSCDIVYAGEGDIPWREDAFDTVLMQWRGDGEALGRMLGEVLRVLRELADRKTTMIIVTHEMHFARDVADRILFMDGGVVVEEGPARQLIDHPREQRTKQFLAHYAE